MARQGRRLCRTGHRRQLHREDRRLLFQRGRAAALRDHGAALWRGLSNPLRLAQRRLKHACAYTGTQAVASELSRTRRSLMTGLATSPTPGIASTLSNSAFIDGTAVATILVSDCLPSAGSRSDIA